MDQMLNVCERRGGGGGGGEEESRKRIVPESLQFSTCGLIAHKSLPMISWHMSCLHVV